MAFLNCAQNSEFYLLQSIDCAQNSEFNYGDEINCAQNSEFVVFPELNCAENSEFFYFPSGAYDLITNNATGDFMDYIVPEVIPSLVAYSQSGSINYSPWIKSYSATKVLGGKTNIDITLVQYGSETGTGSYLDFIVKPQADQLNPIHTSLCSSPFKFHGYGSSVYFIFKLSVGHPSVGWQDYEFPYLLASNLNFDGTELHLFLEDFTVLLEKEDQTMTPDINADEGLVGYAHSTIRAICNQYGISSVVLNFPDYMLRLLRRVKAKPIDWIDQIIRIYQAKRNFIGRTMVINRNFSTDDLTPSWSFDAATMIEEGSFELKHDLMDYRNKFTVIRSSPNGGVIGEQECIGYQCPGRTGNINFSIPVNYASALIEVTNGLLTDFVYFDSLGAVVTGPLQTNAAGTYFLASSPVSNVKFTYVAAIGDTQLPLDQQLGGFGPSGQNSSNSPYGTPQATATYTPRYKVTFFGKRSTTGIDTDYRFIVQASNDEINCLGLRPESSEIDDPIIPNASVAQDYGQSLLKEALRKVLQLSFSTPYVNPNVEVGQCIAVTDYETNMNGTKWIVETVTYEGDGNESTMKIEASRGRL